jgi:hypothetical protein
MNRKEDEDHEAERGNEGDEGAVNRTYKAIPLPVFQVNGQPSWQGLLEDSDISISSSVKQAGGESNGFRWEL